MRAALSKEINIQALLDFEEDMEVVAGQAENGEEELTLISQF